MTWLRPGIACHLACCGHDQPDGGVAPWQRALDTTRMWRGFVHKMGRERSHTAVPPGRLCPPCRLPARTVTMASAKPIGSRGTSLNLTRRRDDAAGSKDSSKASVGTAQSRPWAQHKDATVDVLKRESTRRSTTQQWLRSGNGLALRGLGAAEAERFPPFKVPSATKEVCMPHTSKGSTSARTTQPVPSC